MFEKQILPETLTQKLTTQGSLRFYIISDAWILDRHIKHWNIISKVFFIPRKYLQLLNFYILNNIVIIFFYAWVFYRY